MLDIVLRLNRMNMISAELGDKMRNETIEKIDALVCAD